MGRYHIHVGEQDKPLLMAYHGLGQSVVGWRSRLPWFWSFLNNSKIVETCKELGWSCCLPQASATNWTRRDISRVVYHLIKARTETRSRGSLFLYGFSDGAIVYDMTTFLLENATDPNYIPKGVWVHSGLAPKDTGASWSMRSCKAYITCNASETRALPFNQGRSMQDERLLSYDWHISRGYDVVTKEGAAEGHCCDPQLNLPALQWLAS